MHPKERRRISKKKIIIIIKENAREMTREKTC
jgi:hypothetical protein